MKERSTADEVRTDVGEGLGFALYVSPQGDDGAPGTLDRPLQTLGGARERIRSVKQREGLPKGGIHVWLRGGTYRLSESFVLTGEDSGKVGSPVVYESYPGEEPIIVGGVRLPEDGWTRVKAADVRERLPEAARDHVVQFDLKQLGLTEWGEVEQTGMGYPPRLPQPELFVDGREMTLARYPNTGYFEVGDVLDAGGNPREHVDDPDQVAVEARRGATFRYTHDGPERWRNPGDVWMYGYWYWDWADCNLRLAAVDAASRTLTTEQASWYSVRSGQRYYYYNVLEELDSPGEWYVDRQTLQLYLYPPTALHSAVVELSLLNGPLIALQDASHVALRRLQLSLTRGHGVSVTGGTGVSLEGCRLSRIGGFAVTIGDPHDPAVPAGTGHTVRSCDIADTGSGGIYVGGGERRTLDSGGNRVENNDITRYSRLKRTYSPAIELAGVGNAAVRNYIHDAPHLGILLHGNDHLVEGNEITRVLLETGDAGAIYIGRDWTEMGNVIRGNRIYGIGNDRTELQIGIYLDDMASGTTIVGNVLHGMQRGMLIGGGRSNTITGNVIAGCTEAAILLDQRAMPGEWAAKHAEPGQVMHRRLLDMPYLEEPWRSRYPALVDIWTDEPATPKYNVIRHNLSYDNAEITIGGIRYDDSLAILPAARRFGDVSDNASVRKDDPEAERLFRIPGDPVSGMDPDGGIRQLLPECEAASFDSFGLYADEYRQLT